MPETVNRDTDEPNCQYFLNHKKRKCKALKKIGDYCTEHSYLSGVNICLFSYLYMHNFDFDWKFARIQWIILRVRS